MKLILITLCLLTSISCAKLTGNSNTGEYTAVFFATDVGAYSQTSKKAVMTKMNQSKVPLSIVRTAGTVAGGYITANLAEALSTNSTKEVINASNNALSATQAKETTKQIANVGATTVELEKLPIRTVPPVPAP